MFQHKYRKYKTKYINLLKGGVDDFNNNTLFKKNIFDDEEQIDIPKLQSQQKLYVQQKSQTTKSDISTQIILQNNEYPELIDLLNKIYVNNKNMFLENLIKNNKFYQYEPNVKYKFNISNKKIFELINNSSTNNHVKYYNDILQYSVGEK